MEGFSPYFEPKSFISHMGEIRRLNPKPGMKFGSARLQTMVPDVYVRPGPDGGWHVELNSDTLPRVLVNQTYYAELSKTIRKDGDKSYFTTFIDDVTRKAWVYLTRTKDCVFTIFTKWLAMVENLTIRKLKSLRSDKWGRV